jgi:hypothetical protein
MALPFNLNPEMLSAISQGLLSGRTGSEQLGNAMSGALQAKQGMQQRNKTLEFLAQSPEISQMVQSGVLSPQDGLKAFLTQQAETRKAQAANRKFQTLPDGTYGFADETAGTFTPMGRATKANDNPALVQEFEYAKAGGYKGDFPSYVQFKGQNSGLTLKAPSGFRFTDETQSALEPIPGGPGEQIAGELAARVGMADNFQKQLPAIKRKVQEGAVTGLVDRTIAGSGRGEQGEVYRQIQSGVDALQRLLTGAGMNNAEAAQYAQRYLPTYLDDAKTVTSKLDQLSAELESTKAMALRGRGGSSTPQAPQQPGAVVDYTDYFK